MRHYIEERALELGSFIIENRSTVRAAAQSFGISKSTVHKDVTERLPKLDPLMAGQVKRILDENKAERHIRGGEATKMKYSRDGRNSRKVG
ncbi:MAG: sporulation transcriptional regulator SpoIIID [Clostridiaceae bacterium]|nr:sporulation transcriptional regulator SpoIIID [Clostridiaceae bacterium]